METQLCVSTSQGGPHGEEGISPSKCILSGEDTAASPSLVLSAASELEQHLLALDAIRDKQLMLTQPSLSAASRADLPDQGEGLHDALQEKSSLESGVEVQCDTSTEAQSSTSNHSGEGSDLEGLPTPGRDISEKTFCLFSGRSNRLVEQQVPLDQAFAEHESEEEHGNHLDPSPKPSCSACPQAVHRIHTGVVQHRSYNLNGAHEFLSTASPNPVELDLSGLLMGDDGMARIAPALAHNLSVTSLNLGSNRIGVDGARWLAEALMTNITLTSLTLRGNYISCAGAEQLAKALEQNSTLTSINLSGNGIASHGAQCLAAAFKANDSLRNVALWSNALTSKDAQHLIEAVQASCITSLDLRGLATKVAKEKELLIDVAEMLACKRPCMVLSVSFSSSGQIICTTLAGRELVTQDAKDPLAKLVQAVKAQTGLPKECLRFIRSDGERIQDSSGSKHLDELLSCDALELRSLVPHAHQKDACAATPRLHERCEAVGETIPLAAPTALSGSKDTGPVAKWLAEALAPVAFRMPRADFLTACCSQIVVSRGMPRAERGAPVERSKQSRDACFAASAGAADTLSESGSSSKSESESEEDEEDKEEEEEE